MLKLKNYIIAFPFVNGKKNVFGKRQIFNHRVKPDKNTPRNIEFKI